MLFHIRQAHVPADCPHGKGGSKSLFDESAPGIKLLGYYLAFPQHTTFLIVEADDVASLQRFLAPGANRCVAEITPVSDRPAA